ncbi:MAG: efflux transporter outer membrane subunit [Paludibacteraceae bacterium]|nr:efflux transporter outer membrane subunit [Paludibacteraceae bacterium]
MKKYIYIIVPILLTGCGIYGKYKRPEHITGEHLYGQEISEQADSTTLAALSYNEIFTDPYLQELIETAIKENADIKSLELAVRQAQAGYKASRLAFVPSLTFIPQGGYNINNTPGWSYSLPVALDWEIDLFGRLLNQKRRAGAALQMTQDAREAAQTQIVATVASLYYQLLALDAQLNITDSTTSKWRETVRIMSLMKEAGMMNEVSVSQTQATCYAIEAGVLELKQAINSVEVALCTIIKQPTHHIERGVMTAQVLPTNLQIGVSAQLLANRPDVRQAEHNLEQYYYGENLARAQFYPAISISGTALWNGEFLKSFLGSLTQPIFARGGLRANLEVAMAQHEQAVLQFEQKLIQAGGEVNQALVKCNTARSKHTLRAMQVDALHKAMENTQSLMTNGSATYLEVIYAQQSLLDAQNSQIQDWLDEAQGVVSLYQALGGGTH